MPNWKPIVGLAFDADGFDAYCRSLTWTGWRPSFVVLHNTGVPTLAQRPTGFSRQHIDNLVVYYRDVQHWSAGPHLFIDDRQIWVFTPLTTTGRHSPSWNAESIGVEMLGDYDSDAFDSGRGLAVRRNMIRAVASIDRVIGLSPSTLRLHKEDPKTTHDCPGGHVDKRAVIDEIANCIDQMMAAEHDLMAPHPE